MTWRKGHGTGAGVPRIEVLPPDELPPASPSFAVRTDRGPDGRFVRGNTAQRSKVIRPGRHGHSSALATKEDYVPFERWGRRYSAHRRAELAALHGGELSAGPSAMIESAAMMLADSRYLHALAKSTGDPIKMKESASLAEKARQQEMAAWEIAAREADARPDSRAVGPYVPHPPPHNETRVPLDAHHLAEARRLGIIRDDNKE